MINNLILVGRLAEDPKVKELSNNMKVCNITLAVSRPFRDMNTGEYGVDFIPISLWNGIIKVATDYCSKGDIIGIKGRVSTRVKEENGVNHHFTEIIGERISLIKINKSKDGLKLADDVDEFDDIPELKDDED